MPGIPSASNGGPVLTAEGVTIETVAIAQFESAEIDTIVVLGALDMEPTLADHRLVDWLAVHAPRARRTAAVCAGAFLLAEAGLLDGRRAMAHWASCELLDQRYGNLTVEPDAIFVQDGPIWTSVGAAPASTFRLPSSRRTAVAISPCRLPANW